MGHATADRGLTPVLANILLIAVVVVIAATIGVFALGFTGETTTVAPTVGESDGELVADRPGSDDQIVRITHEAGDTVQVEDMEIVVTACDTTARIVNLPAPTTRTTSTPTYLPFDTGNFEGDGTLLSEGQAFGNQEWNASVLHEDTTNDFTAGRFFEFRIANGGCSLDAGDTVEVWLVHTPSEAVFVTEEMTAT
jgi:flagellin-like protein